ncbi:hypothetical protein ACSS7Z_10880 [Microbacterium sp. A82]|uniref:hypothetical protein n=1 Tax=Microbacterium sp. A82 TaxID=3450452 RepID=UPI003F3C1E07
MRMLRRVAAGATCVFALALTGCTWSEDASANLCAEDIVVACEGGDGWLSVTIGDDADEQETLAFARRLHSAGASENLTAGVTLQRETADARQLDPEVEAPALWKLTVYPAEETAVESDLTGMLAVADVPGVRGIGVADGWPYVRVSDLEQFDDVFMSVSSTPLFEHGGTYTLFALEERLRIVHVPSRTADVAILEVIDLARSYPAAEVLLEAPTAGPQYPTLYVARLTPEQVHDIDARLRQPHLAGADVDGYPVEFVLGSIGPDGVTYTGGTFGDIPPS